MKHRRLLFGLLAVCLVGSALWFNGCSKQKADAAIDESAASRPEGSEGDVHYIDDEAIALAGSAETDNTANEAAATLAYVNSQRQNAGLQALVWNDGLAQAAQVRAQEAEASFSHTRPNGTEWWTVNSAIMYGENLAKDYFDADSVVKAWMDSPTHKANIMSTDFVSVGVAAYQAENGSWYWAQAFGLK